MYRTNSFKFARSINKMTLYLLQFRSFLLLRVFSCNTRFVKPLNLVPKSIDFYSRR